MAKIEPKKKPRISVLERRLQNPHGEPSAPIDLIDPELTCHVFNRAVGAQQIYKARRKGWEYVTPDQVVDMDQAGGFRISTDGQRLVRGEREEEVLMCMPESDRQQIELAKARKNVEDVRLGRQKDAVAQAVAQRYGDQAADFVSQAKLTGEITDNRERIRVTPETE